MTSIKSPQVETFSTPEQRFIQIDNKQLTILCEKFPAEAIKLRIWVKEKINYYCKRPFKNRTREEIYQPIKEELEFINTKIDKEEIESPKVIEQLQKSIHHFYGMKDLAKKFIKEQPCLYDTSKNWWLWNHKQYSWELIDETDILNSIDDNANVDTINSKIRTELLESLRQVSRKNKPKPIKETWIQFKDKIFDVETGETFKASPEYFITNPIPWKLTESSKTPTMDKIFKEWVGEKYVQTLYEILAYSILPDYPIHRLFCFIGDGMNGKSCFLNLLRKFVGTTNCCSTELDTLLTSRFEVTRLHKKLVCQMGETNFNEMNKTSLLKKLSGGDLIGFEYKNKNPFEEKNYAKIIIATNNLPSTSDKTIGFYRRWMIIDFPNRFSEKKDILKDIPEEEYKSLALKCCAILKGLLKNREFTNEGTIEERIEKYEAKSNFLEQFVNTFTIGSADGYITKADFYKKFLSWSVENRHRKMSENSVGSSMKKLGFESAKKYFNWLFEGKGGQIRVWIGIKWKE